MKNILNKQLSLFLLLSALVCSCQNASFTEPGTTIPVSDFWYTGVATRDIRGFVHDSHGGGHNPLKGQVIAAWEMPNDPSRSLYVYGIGALTGYKDYTFTMHFRDTLPKFVLLHKDTTNAIAVAHIFIVGNMAIKNGDTLRYNSYNWDALYQMIGSMNEVGVIFAKGTPMLAGQSLQGFPPGINLLQARRIDARDSVTDFDPVDPFKIGIEIDDDGKDCQKRTPFWIQ